MDYTLVIVYANGESYTERCATSTDVCNYIASSMRSQFKPDLDRGIVTFHVIDNTKSTEKD